MPENPALVRPYEICAHIMMYMLARVSKLVGVSTSLKWTGSTVQARLYGVLFIYVAIVSVKQPSRTEALFTVRSHA